MGFGIWDLSIRVTMAVTWIVVSLSLACVGERSNVPPVETPTREVRDDLGRTVIVPEKIERAISLAPNITEMIFAVGAGDRLVGVTAYCNYPPEATAIEKVGDTQTPNIERIIALKPQIVFISTASQLEAFSRTLKDQGISVYVTNPKGLTGVFRNMTELGTLFGRGEYANGVVISLAGRESWIRHQANYGQGRMPRNDKPPRVFVQISREPLFTIGRDSFLTEIVETAGGVSTTKDIATAYPTISKETALAMDPEVIFLSDSDDNREPSEALKYSSAVRNGRVYKIDADIISRPGPRLVDALEDMASKLREKK
jgi:iron complex transport system substrate-binding protein